MLSNRTIRSILSLSEGARVPPKHDANAVGIEIELENFDQDMMNRFRNTVYWSLTADGSLRNNGYEILSKPLYPARMDAAFRELTKLLAKNHLEVTQRCSIHVHLNMLENTEEELLNFMLLYTAYESLLEMISGYRITNNYCLGVAENLDQFSAQMQGIRDAIVNNKHFLLKAGGIERDRARLRNRGDAKYGCMSIERLKDLGTIEIRIHEGTKDVQRIRDWADILLAMKSTAEDKGPEDILEALSGDPEEVFGQVFGNKGQLFYDKLQEEEANGDIIWDRFRKGYYRAVSIFGMPNISVAQLSRLMEE